MGFLNRKIFNEKNATFGLDLSDLSIKVVQLKNKGTFDNVVGYSSVSLPVGCISDGEIKKKEYVISAIKKALETAMPKKIKLKKVVCSLPESKAFLRIVSVPKMNEKEMAEAVKWEMEANIPLPLEQVYYDWQIIPEELLIEKNKANLLVAAISKTTVDEIIGVLEESGLEPVGLEIESIAQARSLIADKNNQTILIVDIGDRRTTFSANKEGLPCFTSSVPICGQVLTDVIAKGMNISFEEAEKLKITYGIGSDFKNDPLFKLQKPVLESLVQEIERSIDFYLTCLKYSQNIDKIILCGGGANMKGLLPYLSKKLGREMELGNTWTNIRLGKNLPIIERSQSLQYSTAIGLALKGMHYEDIY